MATAKHGLGRGLSALIKDGSATEPTDTEAGRIRQIPVAQLRRNPMQPRRHFDEQALAELTASVSTHGVLQPLLVRAVGNEFELIAGERRFRAAQAAGLTQVPAIVTTAEDQKSLALALVENLQRADLNVIEEAEGYKLLAEKFDLTQEQISTQVGKARATVANALRILGLPDEVRKLVFDGTLSAGHAKILSAIELPEEQSMLARRVVRENLSVRNLEKLVQATRKKPAARPSHAVKSDIPATHLHYLSEKLHRHFGTSVRITPTRTLANGRKARGTVEIDFYSSEEFDRLLSLLGLVEE